MKLRKITAFLLTVILLLGIGSMCVFAGNDIDYLREKFVYGIGPETEGFSIDYRYYSPVKQNDSTKYPLVIWLHGMGDGAYDGRQIERSDIALWASDDYQSRFKGSGGAFILAARSVEEKELYWTDELIYPLRSAIDDFISKNKANIDVSRIYVGGYSMGGKMTLKMAVAYPELFAAAFPICPAWVPGEDAEILGKHTGYVVSRKNFYGNIFVPYLQVLDFNLSYCSKKLNENDVSLTVMTLDKGVIDRYPAPSEDILSIPDEMDANYTDAFFINKENGSFDWLYYNPDGHDGNGQFVINHFYLADVFEAADAHKETRLNHYD